MSRFSNILLVAIALSGGSALAECNFIVKAAIQIKGNNNLNIIGKVAGDFSDIPGIEGGCFREYQNGSIYASNKVGAQMIYGSIRAKWKALGGVTGFLGLPTTDESATPDGVGRYNHFTGGSVYWHPCIGAFSINGLIRGKWAALGWENSSLGYPKSDELKTSDGVGRYSDFQNGRIYWHPQYGTYQVSGGILRQWGDLGFEKSSFGYPIEDSKCGASTPCTQKFNNGLMVENWNTVDMRGTIARRGIAIRNQGDRPTCSVFATTFLLEYAYTAFCGKHLQDLSEEYLNHAANLATGGNDDGDFFSSVVAGYHQYGVATEGQFPYQKTYDFNSTHFSSELVKSASYHVQAFNKMKETWIRKIAPTPGLNNTEFNQLLAFVRKGVPVAIGRSHSLVVVGYEMGSQYPGGGRFIIRNSYGPNLAGTINGYQYEDFKSVKDTVYDAVVFTR